MAGSFGKTTKETVSFLIIVIGLYCFLGLSHDTTWADWQTPTMSEYSKTPPFVTASVPPLVMLVLGRDHKLYYEAYNDASDLNEDGVLDITYKPDQIDYYGYFDSYKYYSYSSANGRFEPAGVTADKKAPAGSFWSGDFLNYLTMSRMDAIRKVLYGGYRYADTATETVLARAYIPQDAHSWGKEYESISRDGYDIRDYTPLDLPQSTPTQTRHLFASTSLVAPTDASYRPLLRVLPNNTHRIWEWVAKESPVADSSLVTAGGTSWELVPQSAANGISNVTQTVYSITGYGTYPTSHAAYNSLVATYATAARRQGSQGVTTISGSGNPFGSDDNYLTLFNGTLNVPSTGTYTFAIDGDDAVEFLVDINGDGDFEDTGEVVAGWYGSHGACSCQTHTGSVSLNAGSYTFQFRHQEISGADSYTLYWQLTRPASDITDYTVRVLVGLSAMPEANCKQYPNGTFKPIGILQRRGETENMYFGLITGSYAKNTSGGVLRKNISAITDEINASTGQFTAVNGIIRTIDKLRISEYNYADYSYLPGWDGAWVTTRPMNEGEFPDWGNPIGEMMYEALRYFGGTSAPLSAYHSTTMTEDNALGLPNAAWIDPYGSGHFPFCAKPFILAISDINPSYDSDQLPGAYFGSMAATTVGAAGSALNVRTIGDQIYAAEMSAGKKFIGQEGSTSDGACTDKNVNGFGDIRGLCPEEPTKQGSYYSASVAFYGRSQDISAATAEQNVRTYAVGLSSPLPKIEIPIQGRTIRLVPFAKSVGGCLGLVPTAGSFQPTNTIVDFFVEDIQPHYGRFRINFEDVEQAADHDMDAIILYQYRLIDIAGNPVTASTIDQAVSVEITLTSEYASGCIIQHAGYIISGTTADGTYLEVRDSDTATGSDVDYFLDTPNIVGDLPQTHTRTFTASTTGSATTAALLPNPLWYAAKWGGFEESETTANGLPDQPEEWDKDNNGIPDTYFYVVNPLKLEEQLNASFDKIAESISSGTAASVISNSRSGEGAMYQSIFYPERSDYNGRKVNWVGQIHALLTDAYGNLREDTDDNQTLDDGDMFLIFDGAQVHKFYDDNANGIFEDEERLNAAGTALNPDATVPITDVHYLWSSNEWLNELTDPLTQRSYSASTSQRHIFTFVDADGDMVADSGEQKAFVAPTVPSWSQVTDPADFYAYLHTYLPFSPPVATTDTDFQTVVATQAKRIVDYIRGADQGATTAGAVALPAFRTRQIDYDDDGIVETWRLGDIIHSTPKLVEKPFEEFDLLYGDEEYTTFYQTYKNRRNVVYAGANDGMLHAFNAGFFNPVTGGFVGHPVDRSGTPVAGSYNNYTLGAEIWAYVPFNLLPHLYWLTNPSYSHVNYCDLEVKVFDAKIFAPDAVHPNGWGTVLVGGMGFGGGKIATDVDKSDGSVFDPKVDRVMSSAFFILDITNPEQPPAVLAEITFPDLGFTTCFPAVIPMRERDPVTGALGANQWYLVFGSGPTGTDGPDMLSMLDGTSRQQGVIYAIDLVRLGGAAGSRELWTATGTGTKKVNASAGPYYLAQLPETNSFVSEPISVDWALDYNTDAVYFGISYGDHVNGWNGALRRLVLQDGSNNPLNPSTWDTDSVLISLSNTDIGADVGNGQPVVAAPTVGLDQEGQRWVYFGTGRFYSTKDRTNTDRQSYYGIKEPYAVSGSTKTFTWDTVGRDDLLNVTDVKVYRQGDYVQTSISGVSNFDTLVAEVAQHQGWVLDLVYVPNSERNLGQAVLAGDILTFTGYIPSNDACSIEGRTDLYALHYLTGTAYYESVIGLDYSDLNNNNENVLKRIDLGAGLSLTPNIHVGREKGSSAMIQSSTGAVENIEEINPGVTKSGKMYWKMDDEVCP